MIDVSKSVVLATTLALGSHGPKRQVFLKDRHLHGKRTLSACTLQEQDYCRIPTMIRGFIS